MKVLKNLFTAFKKITPEMVVFACLSLISIAACIYFYHAGLNLSSSDGLSRMNIARKVLDNLTPGFGQFGSVWPFLPQLLMVPFVAIDPLWHTGIAGMLLSAPSFIFAGFFLYLLLRDLTQSKFAAGIAALIFATNINLLLLQTMGMSEPFFIMCTLGAMYMLVRWSKNPTKNILDLIIASGFLSAACLTRYEGIALTGGAIFAVGLILLLKKYSLRTVEGMLILFSTIALFGLFLWCMYNALIFHDPIYWARIYTGQNSVISTEAGRQVKAEGALDTITVTYLQKIHSYFLAIAEMAGLPAFIIGVVSFFVYLISSKPWKNVKNIILLLPLFIVAFMMVTFYKSGLPIESPQLTWQTVHQFKETFAKEYNVRYGILLWPFIVIMIGWVFSKGKILKALLIVILLLNIATPLDHKAFLIYQLQYGWQPGVTPDPEQKATIWLKSHYDSGLILISALKHDPVMFKLNLPYKTFIHEGTGNYWLVSRKNPEVYAEWVVMTDKNFKGNGEKDPVTEYLADSPDMLLYYHELYNDGIILIYKRNW